MSILIIRRLYVANLGACQITVAVSKLADYIRRLNAAKLCKLPVEKGVKQILKRSNLAVDSLKLRTVRVDRSFALLLDRLGILWYTVCRDTVFHGVTYGAPNIVNSMGGIPYFLRNIVNMVRSIVFSTPDINIHRYCFTVKCYKSFIVQKAIKFIVLCTRFLCNKLCSFNNLPDVRYFCSFFIPGITCNMLCVASIHDS